jgi:hypothetical protein
VNITTSRDAARKRPRSRPAGRRGAASGHAALSAVRSVPLKLSVVLTAALIAIGIGLAAGNHASASSQPPRPVPCPRGMPAAKCASVAAAAKANASRSPSQAGPVRTPLTPAPVIRCGARFFSQAIWDRLGEHFGNIICFRFPGQDRWIIAGNGVSLTAHAFAPSQGGAILAVQNCRSRSCLNPNAAHGFGGFDVSRAPDPGSYPLDLEATFESRYLLVYNAYCAPFTFDTATLEWHGGMRTTIEALRSHPSAVAAIPVSRVVNGNQALRQARPGPNQSACFG